MSDSRGASVPPTGGTSVPTFPRGALTNVLIPAPGAKWVNPDGSPTAAFFEFVYALWARTGGQTAPGDGTSQVGVNYLNTSVQQNTTQIADLSTAALIGMMTEEAPPAVTQAVTPDSVIDPFSMMLDDSSGSAAGTADEWQAGTVTALGANLELSAGTLSAADAVDWGEDAPQIPDSVDWGDDEQWQAGVVHTIGANLTLSGGTLSASGSGSSQWNAGTVTVVGSGLTLNLGTISAEWQVGTVTAIGAGLALSGASLNLDFGNANLSGLPTSNPGGGKPWLNGGVLQVGA